LWRAKAAERKSCGEEELQRGRAAKVCGKLLCTVDSMTSKRLDHLSVNGCLQMILTGLTPPLFLLRGGVEGRENLPKSLAGPA
jgi:hypothetical protein